LLAGNPRGLLQGVRGGLCREERRECRLQGGLRVDQGLPQRGLSLEPARRQHLRQFHDGPAAGRGALTTETWGGHGLWPLPPYAPIPPPAGSTITVEPTGTRR